jgi:hypothetical protein
VLDLAPGFLARCSACGKVEAVEDDDYEHAHVMLRLKGWTRDASGAQFCPACTASR